MEKIEKIDLLSRQTINLANSRLGAQAVYASDDFFAPKERMLNPEDPVFIPGKYDDNGKWMDGWESRRKRTAGHDFCIVRLGLPGIISAIDLDTSFFTGNYPPQASLDACYTSDPVDDNTEWTELLCKSEMTGDNHNLFEIDSSDVWNHIRVNIYPDGGIARLRVFGKVHQDWSEFNPDELIDFAAIVNGGRALACNNEHFGSMSNIIMPGKGLNMGDGWETRRRREPGNDWVILSLGHTAKIKKIHIDTAFFKGNYPDRVSVDAIRSTGEIDTKELSSINNWQTLMKEQPLSADTEHEFENEINNIGPVTHARINIYPDGGLSRVRLFGNIVNS